jgi:hypothetical protein
VVTRSDDRRGGGGMYFLVVMVLQIVLGILASLVTAWFSRYREFRLTPAARTWPAAKRMVGACAGSRPTTSSWTASSGARHDEDQRPARMDGDVLDTPAAPGPHRRAGRIRDKRGGRVRKDPPYTTGPCIRLSFHRHPQLASRRRLGGRGLPFRFAERLVGPRAISGGPHSGARLRQPQPRHAGPKTGHQRPASLAVDRRAHRDVWTTGHLVRHAGRRLRSGLGMYARPPVVAAPLCGS